MTARTSYAPGTPSWVDLGSPNTVASAEFYGALFGWRAEMDPRPEAGGYGLFTLDGKNVAGLGPQMNHDLPPFWAVYISVAARNRARRPPPPRVVRWWPVPWTCSMPVTWPCSSMRWVPSC